MSIQEVLHAFDQLHAEEHMPSTGPGDESGWELRIQQRFIKLLRLIIRHQIVAVSVDDEEGRIVAGDMKHRRGVAADILLVLERTANQLRESALGIVRIDNASLP